MVIDLKRHIVMVAPFAVTAPSSVQNLIDTLSSPGVLMIDTTCPLALQLKQI